MSNYSNTPEPDPLPNNEPAVWDLVIEDMKDRDKFGVSKYNTRLKPFDGRDNLKDIYQELLDGVVYCRKEIYQRDKTKKLLKKLSKSMKRTTKLMELLGNLL